MTQQEHQIARLTGEPLKTISQSGGSSLSEQAKHLAPEAVQLVVDCPFCGRPVPYPGLASDRSEAMAECDRCDIYFAFDSEEVHGIPVSEQTAEEAKMTG